MPISYNTNNTYIPPKSPFDKGGLGRGLALEGEIGALTK